MSFHRNSWKTYYYDDPTLLTVADEKVQHTVTEDCAQE